MAITHKLLFNEISPKLSFGVSHTIKSTDDDNAPYDYAELYIEPGASKDEVLEYVRKNWSSIKNRLELSVADDSPLVKKVRPKEDRTKNLELEVFDLIKDNPNLTDTEIWAKLNCNGDPSKISKIVRKIKGKNL